MELSSIPMFDRLRPAILAVALMATTGFAKTIHVSRSGSDAATGTLAQPYATIAKAAATSVPGDTVLIRGGTYVLAAQLEPKSGTSDAARITYKAYPGETVLVDGGSGYVATFTMRSYLTFQDLRFTTANIEVGAGMFYFEASKHIVFQGCEFFGMPAQVGGENSSVIRCMSTGWPDEDNLENSESCVFRDNFFHDNASPAFRLYDTKSWIIENNTFVNCAQAVGGKDEPYDLMVRRNLVVGGDLAFYFALQGGGNGVTITENIVVGTGGGFNIGGLGTYDNKRLNVNVSNNTFYNVRSWVYGWTDPEFDSAIRFANNIVYSDSAANIAAGEDIGSRFVCMNKYQAVPMKPSQYSFDNNNYKMPDSDRSAWFIDGRESFNGLSAWSTARPAFDLHSISVDPLFVNSSGSDFHLKSGSLCKGKGKNGEDLGAYPRGDDGTVIGRRTTVAGEVGVHRRIPVVAGSSSALYRFDGRKVDASKSVSAAVIGPEGGSIRASHH